MEGTSFAIPIKKVVGIVQDLLEGRHITHGYLGKFGQDCLPVWMIDLVRRMIFRSLKNICLLSGIYMSTMSPTLARYCSK